MGKDSYRFEYDPVAALRNVPKLLGMDLRECGVNRLQGGYYLNGEPHQLRKDKLKVFVSRGSVWIMEEGGRTVSLPSWLIEFGGAADYKDAMRMIKGESQALHWNGEVRKRAAAQVLYVDPAALRGARGYDLEECPLFRWMCGLFDAGKVREVWEKFNVTTDSHGNAVYWYMDPHGRVLYDKRIAYLEDGHRNKEFFPGRQYRVGDGYSGRCYFGAHLVDMSKRVYVCESEKTALLVSLMYDRQVVATGGKGQLREVEPNMMLLPDLDARIEWGQRGQVWEWWKKWGIDEKDMPETADIGDMIVWKRKRDTTGL